MTSVAAEAAEAAGAERRRSSRLALKTPVRYTEGAPTVEEERDYVQSILPLIEEIAPMPASAEKVAIIGRIFKAAMAGKGRQIVAYHPQLRIELKEATTRLMHDVFAIPSQLTNAININLAFDEFLKGLKKVECYRE
jgi:hypothetical protein